MCAHGYPTYNARDPQYHDTNFAAIRRIEYMQRTAAQGRISPLKPDIELLLYDKWVDPIAGCLGTYLALRMGITNGLGVATSNLVRYFGGLPDSHVLRGMFLLRSGSLMEALGQFREAIDIGLPVFREGMTLLRDKGQSLYLEHGVKERMDAMSVGLAGGQPWSMKLTESHSQDLVSYDANLDPDKLLKH